MIGKRRVVGAGVVLAIMASLAIGLLVLGQGKASAQSSPENLTVHPQLTLAELDEAEALWESTDASLYQISYSTLCVLCDPIPPVTNTVVDGLVATVTAPVDAQSFASSNVTVAGMFDRLRAALADGDDWVYATFDSVDGHPRSYSITPVFNGEPVQDGGPAVRVHGLVKDVILTCGDKPVTMIGSDASEILRGSPYADVIVALGGDDQIRGGAGDDTICGGDGNDEIDGDELSTGLSVSEGRDRIYGEAGDDLLSGGPSIDYIWGGAGVDTIEGGGGSDRIRGGSGDDTITGGSGADRIWGQSGNDDIRGQGGQDQLWGGAGNDDIQGNWQSDQIWGGDGDDLLAAAEGKDTIHGDAGNDELFGGANTDVLYGETGIDTLSGGAGTDTLYGGTEGDMLNGGPHTDTCYRDALDVLSSCQFRLDDPSAG